MSDDLVKRLTIKASIMEMGEQIAWGSDTSIMREASARIEELEANLAKAVAIAKDAIETMECGPFFPDREGRRLFAALAELKGQDDE